MTSLARTCAAVFASTIASTTSAALSVSFRSNPITAVAIAADPVLANMQSWSILVTNTDGHWASAGLRMTLPPGHSFYQTPAARGGGDTHPNVAFDPHFPDLEFDTYVSSARNQTGQNAPAILGPYPETQPPQSFGGPTDPIPGTFSVSWGDPQATQGPGPGTYEILRFTFPRTVTPDIYWQSQTSQVAPDQTIFIIIPEPPAAGAFILGAAGMLTVRRRG
jgi:hypothetical protein